MKMEVEFEMMISNIHKMNTLKEEIKGNDGFE